MKWYECSNVFLLLCRVQLLESVGFVFKCNDKEWHEKYSMLMQFRQNFGTSEVHYPNKKGAHVLKKYTCMCMYACMCVCVCICVCMYVCIYTYIHTRMYTTLPGFCRTIHAYTIAFHARIVWLLTHNCLACIIQPDPGNSHVCHGADTSTYIHMLILRVHVSVVRVKSSASPCLDYEILGYWLCRQRSLMRLGRLRADRALRCVYRHTHTWTRIAQAYGCACVCIYVCIYVCIWTRMCVCMSVCVCMCVYKRIFPAQHMLMYVRHTFGRPSLEHYAHKLKTHA
jgi:hypothetical protein